MFLDELLQLINKIMPPETAMDGDRIGLQIDAGRKQVSKALIALEMTDEVVDEAIENNCDCMIVFHPLIFMPLKQIKFDERVGRITSKLIKNDIALISVHTAYDAYITGTNQILADLLELEIIQKLIPDQNYDGHGMGVLTKTIQPISPADLLEKVHEKLGVPLKYSEGSAKKINTVAIVGGSGSSFIRDALKSGADAFITADITYHTFHALKDKIWIIDPGHYEMEQFVGKGIAELLKTKFEDKKEKLDIIVSRVHTNPVRYYPETDKYIEKQKELLNK
jgi:dinuclear metal center YbgI/SA1388 family protein